MKTTIAAMLLTCLPLMPSLARADGMDRSLDRPVTRAVLASAPKAPAKAPSATDTSKDAPAGSPVAVCNDGKTYYNTTGEHRGACSGHKGVASWADGSPVRSKGGRTTSYR